MAARSNILRMPGDEKLGWACECVPDRITQEQLQELETAQLAAWGAQKRAHELARDVLEAVRRGVPIEGGALKFDTRLGKVPI